MGLEHADFALAEEQLARINQYFQEQAQGERRDFSYVRSESLKWLSIGLADSTMPSTPSLSLEERLA